MKSPGSCWILCSLITSFTAFALAVTIISSILFSCFPDSLAAMFTGKPASKLQMPPLLFNTSFQTKASSSGGGLAEILHLEEELEQLELQVEAAVQRPVHQKLKGGRLEQPAGEEASGERKPCLMLKFHGVRLVCKRRRKAHR